MHFNRIVILSSQYYWTSLLQGSWNSYISVDLRNIYSSKCRINLWEGHICTVWIRNSKNQLSWWFGSDCLGGKSDKREKWNTCVEFILMEWEIAQKEVILQSVLKDISSNIRVTALIKYINSVHKITLSSSSF